MFVNLIFWKLPRADLTDVDFLGFLRQQKYVVCHTYTALKIALKFNFLEGKNDYRMGGNFEFYCLQLKIRVGIPKISMLFPVGMRVQCSFLIGMKFSADFFSGKVGFCSSSNEKVSYRGC